MWRGSGGGGGGSGGFFIILSKTASLSYGCIYKKRKKISGFPKKESCHQEEVAKWWVFISPVCVCTVVSGWDMRGEKLVAKPTKLALFY